MHTNKKRYKIFDYTWHIPHQYDMANALKEDCVFFLCLNTKRQWDISQRPIPENVSFVTHYEDGLYDIALLHIDQSVIFQDGIKNIIYQQMDKRITDIPKIVINHGTPVFPEGFKLMGITDLSLLEMEKKCTEIIKSIVGNKTMVVNSFQSASEFEWGFGVPIVHGINVNDWNDLPKEPRVFTALSPYGFDTYYNRDCIKSVYEILLKTYGHPLSYAKINVDTSQSEEGYKNYLGQSLLYLDTSFRTPMNRARTEAFLSGCCVLQVEGAHDLERWAINGENIIIVPDEPAEIAATIADILENRYREAIEIGQRGKIMAQKHFDPERYRRDWLDLFSLLV